MRNRTSRLVGQNRSANSEEDARWEVQVRSRAGLRPTDHALDPGLEPPIGAHIVTPRRLYTHHGIYMGEGRVVQYGGLSRGLRRGPVEEVSLSEFAQRHEIRVRLEEYSPFNRQEVIFRARLRLGENQYHPLRNNCEHFCEWCVRGEPRSYQVDELTAGCSRLSQALRGLLCRALPMLDPLRRRSACLRFVERCCDMAGASSNTACTPSADVR